MVYDGVHVLHGGFDVWIHIAWAGHLEEMLNHLLNECRLSFFLSALVMFAYFRQHRYLTEDMPSIRYQRVYSGVSRL
jgi:hypothetical protein